MHRRLFLQNGALVAAAVSARQLWAAETAWRPRYALASCLYGTMPLAEILPEVAKVGAEYLDIWPRIHGNQREQVDELGHDRFGQMLSDVGVKLGVITRYDLGPFRLTDELKVAQKFNVEAIVCGGAGPVGLAGNELKQAVRQFAERLKPTLQLAGECGVKLAIENHGNNLIDSIDSLLWLVEYTEGQPLGIALAPYHLPQDPAAIAKLIDDLGDRIAIFYAWEHGKGAMQAMPVADQLKQLPGRGELDFGPIVAALAQQKFAGLVEIFMHSVPRGIPILPTVAEVTAEIYRAREYLEGNFNR
jgi:sugar phosphate isomerase/epimerase